MRQIAVLVGVGLIFSLAGPVDGSPGEKGTVLNIYDPAEGKDKLSYQDERDDDVTAKMTQELHRRLKEVENKEARQRQEQAERDYDKSRQERRSKSRRLREE